jgi:hypothetical protein
MSNDSFGPDLSFLNKKVKPDRRVHISQLFCFDKQASRIQVSDSRSILTSFAIPEDPDSVGLLDSRVAPPRRNTLSHQEALISAYVCPQDHVRFLMRLCNCPDRSTPIAKSPLSLRWQ